jgi:hypothetical protein
VGRWGDRYLEQCQERDHDCHRWAWEAVEVVDGQRVLTQRQLNADLTERRVVKAVEALLGGAAQWADRAWVTGAPREAPMVSVRRARAVRGRQVSVPEPQELGERAQRVSEAQKARQPGDEQLADVQ